MESYLNIINIAVILVFLSLFFITRKTNKRWSKINDYLGKVTTTVDSIRYGDLSKKINTDHPTYQNVTHSINRMVETLNDRERMIAEYQSELMNQNRLLESVINSLSDGILIINDKFEILRATPKILKWFGVRKGHDIVGKNIFDYIQLSDDNAKANELDNDEVFIKHTPTNNFIISSQPLVHIEKKRYVIIIKDVTVEREIETLKTDFAATLTHDLKVPIIAAANMIDLFLNEKFGEISEKQEFALKNMKSSNNELLELVQVLLETYKIDDKGGIELYKEYIDLNSFTQEVVEDMIPLTKDLSIKLNFIPADKKVSINGDKMQLQRVIKNLVSNAINHSNTHKDIDVKIGEEKGFATISVIDYGQGIPKDEIKMIFNKYYSAAKKLRKVGTGLGLYLSQQITEAHGGEITVESEENIRTEFCVKLPM
ncbi:GHKL domain-containing protein [bacterium]|nr:GHKL domain-containing protein [bacterium]